jgi:hypothetical protein
MTEIEIWKWYALGRLNYRLQFHSEYCKMSHFIHTRNIGYLIINGKFESNSDSVLPKRYPLRVELHAFSSSLRLPQGIPTSEFPESTSYLTLCFSRHQKKGRGGGVPSDAASSFLQIPTVHYRADKSSPLVAILNKQIPSYILKSPLHEIYLCCHLCKFSLKNHRKRRSLFLYHTESVWFRISGLSCLIFCAFPTERRAVSRFRVNASEETPNEAKLRADTLLRNEVDIPMPR